MRRLLTAGLALLFLYGCSAADQSMSKAMALREQLLQSQCSFTAKITADYGDTVCQFTAMCVADREGTVTFTVKEPESICGITGKISGSGGLLTFEETVLGFPLLADGEVSPVSAPWLLIKALRSGYLTACGEESEGLRLTINDSYEEDALQLDIWTEALIPAYAEITWQGRRVLSLEVEAFEIV